MLLVVWAKKKSVLLLLNVSASDSFHLRSGPSKQLKDQSTGAYLSTFQLVGWAVSPSVCSFSLAIPGHFLVDQVSHYKTRTWGFDSPLGFLDRLDLAHRDPSTIIISAPGCDRE